ncbi:MAG TPA: hypothetical protein PK537_09280 [Candidatus Limiplasma sp.]|mgnify:CR=1 FL=1|nr:hypothetical protein [Candidatus Limiplasma sp.]
MGMFDKFKRSGEKSQQEQTKEFSDIMSDALIKLDEQVRTSSEIKDLIRSKMGITDETEIRAYGVTMLWSKQLVEKGMDRNLVKSTLITALPIMYQFSQAKAESIVLKTMSML